MRPLTAAVTALRYVNLPGPYESGEILLAGIGNQVHAYGANDLHKPILRQAIVHPSLTIHGFSSLNTDGFLTVHAGRTVCILHLLSRSSASSTLNLTVHMHATHTFDDWVWETYWLSHNTLVVALGHSRTVVCTMTVSNYSDRAMTSDGEGDLQIQHNFTSEHGELTWCATSFVAYSAQGSQQLYTACGTSFGKILLHSIAPILTILSPSLEDNASQLQSKLCDGTHTLDAHAGPVMRIVLSTNALRMASASVDRTIRVWTAISPNGKFTICPNRQCFAPLVTHFGHLARVWDVAFLCEDEGNNGDGALVSVAEDRSCRIWSTSIASQQLSLQRAHNGRNVWTVAVATGRDEVKAKKTNNERYVTIATGGEDGSIKTERINLKIFNTKHHDNGIKSNCDERKANGEEDNEEDKYQDLTLQRQSDSNECVNFSLPDGLPNPRKTGAANDESARTVVFVAGNVLVVTTDFGRILVVKQNEDGSNTWSELGRDSKGTAFTPCSLAIVHGVVCAGQTNGDVTLVVTRPCHERGLVRCGPVQRFSAMEGAARIVMGIFGIEDDNETKTFEHIDNNGGSNGVDLDGGQRGDIFIACPTGDLFHWRLHRHDNANNDLEEKEQVTCNFIRRYEAHRASKTTLVTSVCILRSFNSGNDDVIVVGDKGGRVHLFNVTRTPGVPQRAHAWLRVHDDRVSCLVPRSNGSFLSAGFDGLVVRLRVIEEDEKNGHDGKVNGNSENDHKSSMIIMIESRERIAERADTIISLFPKCNNDNNAVNDESNGFIAAAFRGAILSVWDVARRAELFRHDVGNWRRAHAVRASTNDSSVAVAFWRAGSMYIARKRGARVHCAGVEFHGGRANDVRWCSDDSVITGGEDTIVRITKVRINGKQDENTELQPLRWMQRLHAHISCVSTVATNAARGVAASGGGSDEIVLWSRMLNDGPWRMAKKAEIGVLLRERKTRNGHHQNEDEEENEEIIQRNDALMRVTSIDCIYDDSNDTNDATWLVGRSDGSVVKVIASPYSQSGWTLRAQHVGKHEDGAVLCVGVDTHGKMFVSGGSGGAIHLWHVDYHKTTCRKVWNLAHKGGVNCIAVTHLREVVVVASGGDDETVRIHMLEERQRDEGCSWHSELGTGHRAAVTGVTYVNNDTENSHAVLISVGADHRVVFWCVDVTETDELRVVHKHVVYTAVPDVAAVCSKVVDGRIFVVVCGFGLEVVEGPLLDACKN